VTTLQQILEALPRYRYIVANEIKTQRGVAEVLEQHGIAFDREHVEENDRYDFLCTGGVVVEVKRALTYSTALRQAARYCRAPAVTAVVIATTRPWPEGAVATFNEKPVHVVRLPGPQL